MHLFPSLNCDGASHHSQPGNITNKTLSHNSLFWGEVKAFAFVKVSLKLHYYFRKMFESWSSQALLWNLLMSWESHICVCIKYTCESISAWFLLINLYFCYRSSSWEFRRMKEIRFSSLQVTGCKIKSGFLKLHPQHLQSLIWPNFFFRNTTQMNSKPTP